MDDFSQILINGGLAMLILEGVKLLYKWIAKKPGFDFPPVFYGVAVPTLNILVIPVLAFLGVQGVSMPVDWLGWARGALLVATGSLVSLLFYSGGLKKLKDYRETYRLEKEDEEEVDEEEETVG